MAMIVTGSFPTFADADASRRLLIRRQFRRDDVSIFFLNPGLRHGRLPAGGDVFAEPGAPTGGHGALAGIARGLAVGLVFGLIAHAIVQMSWWVPVFAMLAGAYLGALGGALAHMRGWDDEGDGSARYAAYGGIVLAAHVDENNARMAEEILRGTGAMTVARCDGEWRDGRWHDFDPRRRPDVVA